MKISVLSRVPPVVKVAATFLMAAVLVGTGWAAEKIYKRLTTEVPAMSYITPSGSVGISSNDPNALETDPKNFLEKQKRQREEENQLVAQKKYEFVRAIDRPSGDRYYVYYFHLSDGSRIKWKLPPPRLEEVASLDEHDRKSNEYAAQRQKDIEKAVASGRARLINVIFPAWTEIHVCRDVESGQGLDVRRIVPECPEEGTYDGASVYPGGEQEYEKLGIHWYAESTWQDHLQAIRDGKRELLDVRIEKFGIYEAVREDGSKLVFARELPLQERPETK